MNSIARLLLAMPVSLLVACQQSPTPPPAAAAQPTELQWARAALERNPQLKVVAVDNAKNTIQVRVQSSGELVTFTPGELAAIPIADLVGMATTPVPAEPEPEAAPAAPESPTELAAPKPEYKVEHENGRVRITGPGVSIESHGTGAATARAAAHYDDPIVCDGKRMLQLDGRHFNFAGDGITVRGGCDLYLTNSDVVASGTALTVLDATVHITNSKLTGNDGSLTVSSAGLVVMRTSTFNGLVRRDPQATIQDQGGNTWR